MEYGYELQFQRQNTGLGCNEIPLNTGGAIQDRDVCHTLYSIHTNQLQHPYQRTYTKGNGGAG